MVNIEKGCEQVNWFQFIVILLGGEIGKILILGEWYARDVKRLLIGQSTCPVYAHKISWYSSKLLQNRI